MTKQAETIEKIESNEFIGAIQHRIEVCSKMERTRLTTKTRNKVEIVLDQEREKLMRHVKITLK